MLVALSRRGLWGRAKWLLAGLLLWILIYCFCFHFFGLFWDTLHKSDPKLRDTPHGERPLRVYVEQFVSG